MPDRRMEEFDDFYVSDWKIDDPRAKRPPPPPGYEHSEQPVMTDGQLSPESGPEKKNPEGSVDPGNDVRER